MWLISKRPQGFTLIELVISSGLFAVILGVISLAYNISLRSWGYELSRIEAKSEPTIVLEKFWRDLVKATSITDAQAGRITFNSPAGSIEFSWDSTNQRVFWITGGNSRCLANRISNLDLNYYDMAGNPLTRPVLVSQLPDIRTIQIDIRGQRTYMFSTETINLRNEISPRNLR